MPEAFPLGAAQSRVLPPGHRPYGLEAGLGFFTYHKLCGGGKRRKRQEFPQKCYERHRPRGRLVHNEQFAPFYGSVAFKNAPNLHAGSSQAEMRKDRRLRCSLFLSLPLLAFLVFLLRDQAGALERQKKYQEDIFISK